VVGDRHENLVELFPEEWKLREQIEGLESWLRENRQQLDSHQKWVADIGFCVPNDARGGGPAVTRELMKVCLEVNLEIFLSEYPGKA
jgi:hypothetical protein